MKNSYRIILYRFPINIKKNLCVVEKRAGIIISINIVVANLIDGFIDFLPWIRRIVFFSPFLQLRRSCLVARGYLVRANQEDVATCD